jgi:heme A synthase
LNALMDGLIRSGHAIDLILVVMLIEALLFWRRGRASPMDIALALLPGALILLGARAALVGAPWPLIALPLALSFPVHLADIRRRGW